MLLPHLPWHCHNHTHHHLNHPCCQHSHLWHWNNSHQHQTYWCLHSGELWLPHRLQHPMAPAQPPPVTCTHSSPWCHTITSTATSNNSSNMPATMFFTLLPPYLCPLVLTLCHWCGTFLLYDHTWCNLPKSHTILDAALFYYTVNLSYILLIFLLHDLHSYFHAMKVKYYFIPLFCSSLHSYFHAMKITWTCLSNQLWA